MPAKEAVFTFGLVHFHGQVSLRGPAALIANRRVKSGLLGSHRKKPKMMERQTLKTVYILGFWAAVLAACFAIAYDIGQIVEWAGLMGSGGGAENNSTWLGLVVLLTPSLLLGISFVVMMVALHRQAPTAGKIWSHTGLAFATMYGMNRPGFSGDSFV
jgi:hypothetical protein